MEPLSQNQRIEIPFEWQKYRNQAGYFVTYYGDIYHGFIITHGQYPDRFFILSNNQAVEFRNLIPENRTLENYQRLAWEIRDIRIIKFVAQDQELGVAETRPDTTRNGDQQWKRMFVFGAGASSYCLFGNEKDKQYTSMMRPPLGCDIFDGKFESIIEKYEGAKLFAPVFESNDRDVERCLEEEWVKLRDSYNPVISKRHINLQFYMRELFHWISSSVVRDHYRNNLYSLFANKLQKHVVDKNERIALVSFNYDTILDQFIEKVFDTPFKQMADYIDYNNRHILLFKPHGSCNWGWPIKQRGALNSENRILHEALYEQSTELWDLYYKIIGQFNEMVHKNAWDMESTLHKNSLGRYTINKNKIEVVATPINGTHFPALLMPYRDKDEFVMSYYHQNVMRWFLGEMEELYLIGWKGNEDVFNRLLKNQAHSLKRMVIVNPLEAKKKEVSQNLQKHLDLKKYQIDVVDTFEKFVLEEMDKFIKD